MVLRLFVLGFAALALKACPAPSAPADAAAAPSNRAVADRYDQAVAAYKAVKVDLSSPDLAVKSIWALQEARQALDCAESHAAASGDSRFEMLRIGQTVLDHPEIFGGAGKGYVERDRALRIDCDSRYDRELNEVKSESDTRAVVFATIHNVTPIPPDVEVDKFEREWRDRGGRYKYVFTKVEGQWKLEDLLSKSMFDEKGDYSTDMPKKKAVPVSTSGL